MEDRKSLLWACSLLLCAGCLTNSSQKTPNAPPSPPPTPTAQQPTVPEHLVKKDKDPKAAARLLVATAKFSEREAKSLDKDVEQQFKVRYQAKDRYQLALKLDPGCIDAYRGLGRIYVDLGDFERAEETFRRAYVKFPKESIFWYEMAQMHNRRKDFSQAAVHLQKALDMEPENRIYLTTLGLTMARSGQTEQAVALLSRSMGSASAYYNVARMLLHLQRNDEGMHYLRLALQTNPNLETARELLTEIQGGNTGNFRIDFQAGE